MLKGLTALILISSLCAKHYLVKTKDKSKKAWEIGIPREGPIQKNIQENEFGNDYNDEFQLNSPLRVPIKGSTPTPTDDINDKFGMTTYTSNLPNFPIKGSTPSPTPTPTDDIAFMRTIGSTDPPGKTRVPRNSEFKKQFTLSPTPTPTPWNSKEELGPGGPMAMDARKPGDYAVMEYGVPAPDIMEYGVRWPSPPPPPAQDYQGKQKSGSVPAGGKKDSRGKGKKSGTVQL